jgi:hypothetical protein
LAHVKFSQSHINTTEVILLQAFQIAHARQGDVEDRMYDVHMRLVARSDPEMHNYLDLSCQPTVNPDEDLDHYPQEVLDLCREDSDWETEPETEPEIEE